MIAYLQSRGIDKGLILDCIGRGDLYESAYRHDCIFKGKDANIIRTKLYFPGKRPYKTDNLYETLEKEGKSLAEQYKAETPTGSGTGRKPN